MSPQLIPAILTAFIGFGFGLSIGLRGKRYLYLEDKRLSARANQWAEFSERHGWLDPEDFDSWIDSLQQRVAELETELNSIK